MSQERLRMKKLREVLRLHFECKLTNRKIAKALSLSPTTIGSYLLATELAQLQWQEIVGLNDAELIERIEPHCRQLSQSIKQRNPIDFVAIHNQLKIKGVTRELLHQEYQQSSGSGKMISYTEFCRQYRQFKKTLKPSMRQTHVAGEKTFVDYAGPTVAIYNSETGEVQQAVVFVGVFGASNYTYAEATLTRSLPDWIGSHVRMLECFGGVSEMLIPDNEKSAVNKACYYDPELNPNYTALAAHYNTAVIPTRPYHPKDKAKVEVAVQVVERWILARLRHYKFFSLSELNEAIARLLEELNDKPFKKLTGSRRSHFETYEKAALKPLPKYRYEFVIIKKTQVNLDYHVELDEHYYSVPYQHLGKTVEYHLSENSVSLFYEGQRIAIHKRSRTKGGVTTETDHMPQAHKRHREWTPDQFAQWGKSVGCSAFEVANYLIKSKPHPECCYRIHLGLMNLKKKYGGIRLEEACKYALSRQLISFMHIKSVLQTQADKAPLAAMNDDEIQREANQPPCQHRNLRGATYYSKN